MYPLNKTQSSTEFGEQLLWRQIMLACWWHSLNMYLLSNTTWVALSLLASSWVLLLKLFFNHLTTHNIPMPQIKLSNLSGWNLTRENKPQNHYVRTKTKHLKWPNRILCWMNIKEDDEDVIYPIRTHASAGWWWILDAIRSTIWNWRALKAVTVCTITIPWGC